MCGRHLYADACAPRALLAMRIDRVPVVVLLLLPFALVLTWLARLCGALLGDIRAFAGIERLPLRLQRF